MKRFSKEPGGLLEILLSLGSKVINGVFDTGTSITAVDIKFVQAHPEFFELYSEDANGFDVNGQRLGVSIYKVKSIRLGELKLNDLFVTAFDFKDLRDYLGKDSPFIIGNNVILKANWVLDLRSNHWAVQQL